MKILYYLDYMMYIMKFYQIDLLIFQLIQMLNNFIKNIKLVAFLLKIELNLLDVNLS